VPVGVRVPVVICVLAVPVFVTVAPSWAIVKPGKVNSSIPADGKNVLVLGVIVTVNPVPPLTMVDAKRLSFSPLAIVMLPRLFHVLPPLLSLAIMVALDVDMNADDHANTMSSGETLPGIVTDSDDTAPDALLPLPWT
jgi:hypothetical protein